MRKLYYVGAKHIGQAIANGSNATCCRESLDEAVNEAKRMIRDENLDTVVVVKIIRIVRRSTPPIEVLSTEE